MHPITPSIQQPAVQVPLPPCAPHWICPTFQPETTPPHSRVDRLLVYCMRLLQVGNGKRKILKNILTVSSQAQWTKADVAYPFVLWKKVEIGLQVDPKMAAAH